MRTLLDDGAALPLQVGERRPSFHFPLPLLSENGPRLPAGVSLKPDEWQTIVVVPVAESARENVQQAIVELEKAHLDFVHLRKPGAEVRVQGVGTANAVAMAGGYAAFASITCDDDELRELATKAGLALKGPIRIAVRWPLRSEGRKQGSVYCYLPSEVHSEFGVDVHADFQLGIDRKNLELKQSLPVGAYNSTLVSMAVQLHLALGRRGSRLPSDWMDHGYDRSHASRPVPRHEAPIRLSRLRSWTINGLSDGGFGF